MSHIYLCKVTLFVIELVAVSGHNRILASKRIESFLKKRDPTNKDRLFWENGHGHMDVKW